MLTASPLTLCPLPENKREIVEKIVGFL